MNKIQSIQKIIILKIKRIFWYGNNKIRKVQLNLAKIGLNNKKYNQYEKENSNKIHYSFNKNRKFNVLLDDILKKRFRCG